MPFQGLWSQPMLTHAHAADAWRRGAEGGGSGREKAVPAAVLAVCYCCSPVILLILLRKYRYGYKC